jgi:hypothetical protein
MDILKIAGMATSASIQDGILLLNEHQKSALTYGQSRDTDPTAISGS